MDDRAAGDPDQWAQDERLSRGSRSAWLEVRIHLARGCGGFPRQADRGRCLSAEDASADELTIRIARGNSAAPAQTRGSSARSPSRRSFQELTPLALGRAKNGTQPQDSVPAYASRP